MRVQHASRLPGYSPGSVSHYHGSRRGRARLPAPHRRAATSGRRAPTAVLAGPMEHRAGPGRPDGALRRPWPARWSIAPARRAKEGVTCGSGGSHGAGEAACAPGAACWRLPRRRHGFLGRTVSAGRLWWRSVLVMVGARRVFLSHTAELRRFPAGRSFVAAAEAAVSLAGDAVTDMAYFAARDDQPAEYCQRRVRECDVYAGLIGLRYGSPVRDRPEVSYTELEFEAATGAGLPRLVFLLDEDAALPIPQSQVLDADPGLQARQRAFRDRLAAAGVMVATVASPGELELRLLHALQESRADSTGGQVAGVPAPAGVAVAAGTHNLPRPPARVFVGPPRLAADPGQRERARRCRAAAGPAGRRAHRDHHPPGRRLGPDRRPGPPGRPGSRPGRGPDHRPHRQPRPGRPGRGRIDRRRAGVPAAGTGPGRRLHHPDPHHPGRLPATPPRASRGHVRRGRERAGPAGD